MFLRSKELPSSWLAGLTDNSTGRHGRKSVGRMAAVANRTRKDEETDRAGRKRVPLSLPGKGRLSLVLAPVALAWYYLTQVAPALVPISPDLKVPFPAVMPYLEAAATWSGAHPGWAAAIAAALLLPGLLLPLALPRYFLWLGICVSLCLGFTYYSLSAPVENLIDSVEENVPRRELPDYLSPRKGRQ
jgi:hypothetical protein